MWECDTFFSPCQLQFPRLGLWTEEEWRGLNKASFSFSHPYLFTGRSLQGHGSSKSSDSEVEKFIIAATTRFIPKVVSLMSIQDGETPVLGSWSSLLV